jgi:hypothetical protein
MSAAADVATEMSPMPAETLRVRIAARRYHCGVRSASPCVYSRAPWTTRPVVGGTQPGTV